MVFSQQEYWSGLPFPFPTETVIFNNWEEVNWDYRITEKNANILEPKASLQCLMKACHKVKCLDQEVNKIVL